MKAASAILMLAALGIASSAMFGIAVMSHDGGHAGWCPVAVSARDCPGATNTLAAALLHLDGIRGLFSATAADAATGSLLALLGFLAVLLTFICSAPDQRPVGALRVLPRAAREPRSRRETRLVRWLAFHEHSPSFV